mgnify:CR=1 FL=1
MIKRIGRGKEHGRNAVRRQSMAYEKVFTTASKVAKVTMFTGTALDSGST